MIKNKGVTNALWIIGCKLAQSVLALIIGVLCARFLGPSNYGMINYAASIVGFVTPIMQLGLNSILVNEIALSKDSESKILGTAIGMTVPVGILSALALIGFVSVVNQGDSATVIVCSIYSITLVFQAAEMITYWYQAKLLAKYPSIATIVAYIVVSAYKVYLLVTVKSVYWFAAINAIEHLFVCLILIITYFRLSKQKLQFSFDTAKRLFSKGKYYILSGMMVAIFQQTDKFMLKNMMGDTETGYYSVAVICAGMVGFVYAAIIDSFRPTIFHSKQVSEKSYQDKMSVLYAVVIMLSLCQCLGMTLLAKPLVSILYGEAYLPSIPVLKIAVWYVVFSYFAIVRDMWILAEEKQKYLWIINLLGAVTNIIANFMLIPVAGALGAALASLITNLVASFLSCVVIKPLRPMWKPIMKAFNMKFVFKEIKTNLLHR